MKYCIIIFVMIHVFFIQLTIEQKYFFNETKLEDISISFKMCNICFSEKNEVTAVVIGNWSRVSINKIKTQPEYNIVSLIGLKNSRKLEYYTSKTKYYKIDFSIKPYPAKKIIIYEIEISLLMLSLYKLKETIWWNIYGNYFIENTKSLYSCKHAYEVLESMWKFDILSAIYLCNNGDHIEMYTFNPFSNYAPNIWKEDKIYVQKNLHPFVLYKLKNEFNDSSRNCQDLLFDKTTILNGYPLRIMGRNILDTPYDPNEKSVYKLRGIAGIMYQLILTKLNVSANLTVPVGNFSSSIDSNGVPRGIFKYFYDGNYDIHLEMLFNHRNMWQDKINSRIQTTLCYVSKKKYMTLQEYIHDIITIPYFSVALTTVFTAAALFAYFIKNNIIKMFLEVFRLVSGVGAIYKPISIKEQVTFTLLVIITTSTSFFFQNQLTSMMSAPAFEPLIDTIEDIAKYNFTAYAHNSYHKNYINTSLQKFLKVEDGAKVCLQKMEQYPNIVCIMTCYLAKFNVYESDDTHIASDEKFNDYFLHLVRDDFSLLKRITLLYNRFHETGFDKYILRNNIKFRKPQNQKVLEVNQISMRHLSFLFLFLAWGYGLGCSIFIIEIIYRIFNFNSCFIKCFRHLKEKIVYFDTHQTKINLNV